MKCALNLRYQYVSMEFYHTILLLRITLSIASRKIFLFIKFSQFICRRQIGQENGFLISFFLKWKLLGIENKSTSAIKLKKKSNYWMKIFLENWLASHTLSTQTHKIFVKLSLYIFYKNEFLYLVCHDWLFNAYENSLSIIIW